ncbi:hypothetical protein P0082_02030 [Candidatus Haliotispira prima]|uniref:Uncharacterized protein n=1 Tax=Candidatus Haliotispira prima TaxID=3034016 RepID=A0ABY8MI45_9SPIO|nr:hypothetical protein P0082_02030 [Candidatus Haliotispira prima]
MLFSLSAVFWLSSCQKSDPFDQSLNVYVENPALFYALSVYQQKVDSSPVSIHLSQGLDMFFQLSGGERPVDAADAKNAEGPPRIIRTQKKQNGLDDSVRRLALGGGLFLSSELMQLQKPELYLENLPEEFRYRNLNQESPVSAETYVIESGPAGQNTVSGPHLSPVLIFPALFEITAPEGPIGLDRPNGTGVSERPKDPLLRNLSEFQPARLLSPEWLKEQLLEAPSRSSAEKNSDSEKRYVWPQTPRQVLLEYLKTTPLRILFGPQGFEFEEDQLSEQLRQFIRSYRELFQGENVVGTALGRTALGTNRGKDLGTDFETNQGQASNAKTGEYAVPGVGDFAGAEMQLKETLRSLGIRFARQQQELYQDVRKNYLLGYRGPEAKILPESYPYLYLGGQSEKPADQSEESEGTRPILRLQLDKVLWAGLSKGLSEEHHRQALKFLAWLQSREGQRILQQELPRMDSESTLGLYRGLSLYPGVNELFWQNLGLDWPSRFDIYWQLPHTPVQWKPELFHGLSLEQERLYRRHSALSLIHSFLLPYLFLPEGRSLASWQGGEVSEKDPKKGSKKSTKEGSGGSTGSRVEGSGAGDVPGYDGPDWSLWLRPD